MLNIYGFFHLNIAFSSIDEDRHEELLRQCYWPLLNFVEKSCPAFGIELTGVTAEYINQLDPAWIEKLRGMWAEGQVDVIGAGYAQIIGPLAPPEVVSRNLELGNQILNDLLSMQPKIALINEQAFSSGLLPHYRRNDYEAIIMEWNNPSSGRTDWNDEWKYHPQIAIDDYGNEIKVIWNGTLAFQKFQRYVHGDITLDEYIAYVESHINEHQRNFPIYGSDVEIFNFRPRRFATESSLSDETEWERMSELMKVLSCKDYVNFIKPSQLLVQTENENTNKRLNLTTAVQPIAVKKQPKYNITRWGVSGRDDFDINTRCRRLYEILSMDEAATEADWKKLCYFWGSDFRTHITETRWAAFQKELAAFEEKWPLEKSDPKIQGLPVCDFNVQRQGHYLSIEGERLSVVLNCRKGLAIETFADREYWSQPLIGTIKHGDIPDINWAHDMFSGHLSYELAGRQKVTDIYAVDPKIERGDGDVRVTGSFETPLGKIAKTVTIDVANAIVNLHYKLAFEEHSFGSLRCGYITLFPSAFDEETLRYQTHLGGTELESFNFSDMDFNHGRSVSALISSTNAITASEGFIAVGDADKKLILSFDPAQNAFLALMQSQKVKEYRLVRLCLTAQEMDETLRARKLDNLEFNFSISAGR